MNLVTMVAIAMLVAWALATFLLEAPGWIHLLLTAGAFLLVWGIVTRKAPRTGGK